VVEHDRGRPRTYAVEVQQLATDVHEAAWSRVARRVPGGRHQLGMVGQDEVSDFTAMGDNVNLTARLSGEADGDEMSVTDATRDAAGIEEPAERRVLELKSIDGPIEVSVLRATERQQIPSE
jgi:class 3 adenylate cyclase